MYDKERVLSFDVVEFAYQIIEMQNIINNQARQIEHLQGFKEKFFELSDQVHNNTNKLVGTVLKGLLNQTITPKPIS